MAASGTKTIIVIGAGIAGVCCALALREDGHDVLMVDQNGPGEGCSSGNAGQFNVGSSLPISMPGMLFQVPRWLMDPTGPLAVRWHYLPKALPWLIRWIRAGLRDRVPGYAVTLRALHANCIDLYRQWLGTEGTADLLRFAGHLYVWESTERSALDLLSEALREANGIRSVVLDSAAIRNIEPALAPIFQRGLYFPDNGHTVNPQRLVQTLAEHFVAAGGVLQRRTVTGFDCGPEGVRAVLTDAERLPCDIAVLAAGAWSRGLAAKLGTNLPLETERGYHAMLPSPEIQLRVPVSNAERTFVLTPMELGMRLAGTVEIGGLTAPPDYARARILITQAARMVPGLNSHGAALWMGFRPSFPDSLPVIDRAKGVPNAYLAFGHGHTGISGAPMTGRLIADMISGRPPTIDTSPFRASRFHSHGN